MKKKIIIITSVILITVLLVIGYWMNRMAQYSSEEFLFEARQNKIILDSLVASGKHGYYSKYFIVGRVKTKQQFNYMPFEVEVLKIKPNLLHNKIYFKFIDSTNFSISFSENEKQISLKGKFGKVVENSNLQLLINKSASTKNSKERDIYSFLKSTNYYFEVEEY